MSDKPVTDISFVIEGEPASKANSRRLVSIRGKPAFIKSAKAMAYAAAFRRQCPALSAPIEGPLGIAIDIYYASMRPDLDPSLVFDLLQGTVYKNDRQLMIQVVRRGLDKHRPRAEIKIWKINGLADCAGAL